MKTVSIDRTRRLADEPRTGHNRWHPDIPPVIEVEEGEEVALETRDALDAYLTPSSTIADFSSIQTGAVHPLTGPVLIKGARPGDLLEVSSSTSCRSAGPSRPSCRAWAFCVT
jgi:formamidase